MSTPENRKSESVRRDEAWKKRRSVSGNALIIGVLGTNAVGGLLFIFGQFFGFELNMPIVAGVVFCLFALAGGIYGRQSAARRIQQKKSFEQAADDLHLDSAGEAEQQFEERLRTMFLHYYAVQLTHTIHRQSGRARLCVGTLRLKYQSGAGGITRQTVAYFESAKLSLPNFNLSPETGVSRFVHSLMGAEALDIDFDDHPEFSEAYHLNAKQREWTRKLFGKRILNLLAKNPGLEIHAEGDRLAILHPEDLSDSRELKRFARLAVRVFRLLLKASRKVRPTEREKEADPHAAAALMTGPFGRMVQRSVIAQSEIDALLAQTPPRSIPRSIRRAWRSCSTMLVLYVGGMFALGGLFFFIVGGFLASVNQPTDRIWFRSGGLVFFLGGLSLVAFPWLWYRRRLRLLAEGTVAEAVVEHVERTNFFISSGEHSRGSERRYRALFRYRVNGNMRTASINVYGPAAKRAMRLAEKKSETRIVYDPERPWRIFWPESMVS